MAAKTLQNALGNECMASSAKQSEVFLLTKILAHEGPTHPYSDAEKRCWSSASLLGLNVFYAFSSFWLCFVCINPSRNFFLTQPFVMSCIRHFDISITNSTKTLPLWTFASFSRYLCVFILTFIKISTIRIAKTQLTLNYRTIVSFLIIQPYLTFITFFTCNK